MTVIKFSATNEIEAWAAENLGCTVDTALHDTIREIRDVFRDLGRSQEEPLRKAIELVEVATPWRLVRDGGDYSWRFMRGRRVVDDLAVPRGLSFLLRSIEQWEVAMIAPFSPPAGDDGASAGEE